MALLSGYRIGPTAVVLIAMITSVIATLATLGISSTYLASDNPGSIAPQLTAALGDQRAQPVQCGGKVYSPVQNSCVEQSVFDDEMQRLFKALGIDPSIYQRKSN